jgi:hypothetical protein
VKRRRHDVLHFILRLDHIDGDGLVAELNGGAEAMASIQKNPSPAHFERTQDSMLPDIGQERLVLAGRHRRHERGALVYAELGGGSLLGHRSPRVSVAEPAG